MNGHLWVFSNEIAAYEGALSPGCLIDLYNHRDKFLGRGFCNPHSLISIRLLTRQDEELDDAFFSRAIEKSFLCRKSLFPDEDAYRLIFGESDGLPGLVVDRFGKTAVVQSSCLGMDLLLEKVLNGLRNNLDLECVLYKNDSSIRSLENLPEDVRVVSGEIPKDSRVNQKFGDQTLHFFVDVQQGQKTGFFFDQRENRERLKDYVSGKTVLDCFSYTGGFGLYAACAGASSVTAIESSVPAGEMLKRNFADQGKEVSLIREDVSEILERFQKEKRKFDIIVLDPPALAKSKKHLFSALRKYQKLNATAISLLSEGGILFSSSCSYHVSRSGFLEMVSRAAQDAGRRIRLLEMRGQSRDHPILVSMPETDYLKCAILRAD
ncbi:MAG: class I SAM-dependent rRNA methyltransferase [Elusimicrobia bacterium]|nr:class I SAM-dependent rRNA methyltransferase [Elusimicrobiota bacterium]